MRAPLIHQSLERRVSFSLGALGVFVFVTVWSLLTYSGKIDALFMPTPTAVVASAAVLFGDGFIADIGVSIFRILSGFALSIIIAVPLGMLIGIHKKTAAFLDPVVSFVRYIPPSAFVPLFVLWFGIGEAQKILAIFIAVAPYLTILVVDVVSNTRKELLDAALTLGAKARGAIIRVIVPNSLPGIWDALRIMIGVAWTFVIFAEVVAATSGLGHVIVTAQRFLKTSDVVAALAVVGILGLVTDQLLRYGYRYLFRWTEKSRYART